MTGTITLLRPSDMLVLTFELVGWDVSEDRTRLERTGPDVDPLIVVRFPPQAVAEAKFTAQPPRPPIRTALAGETRLVFRVPGGDLPLTSDTLLDWTGWEAVLAPTALARGTAPAPGIPAPAFAGALETSIEFPWRLTLSPDATSRWRTDTAATDSPHEQLWSAVLTQGEELPPGVASPPRDLRALGAFRGPEPFGTLPDTEQQKQIVKLTSNFHLPIPPQGGLAEFTPEPIAARRLELTALGANADLEGRWTYPDVQQAQWPPGFDPIGLRQYQHIAGLGRDTFVRTVSVGWLCGTGHRAVVVTTVQRMPANLQVVASLPEGALFSGTGYLIETYDVIVQQPWLDYQPLSAAFAHGGRELPLRSIQLTTTTARVAPVPADKSPSWLLAPDGSELRFEAIGTDIAGGTFEFALPLMFVPYESIGKGGTIRRVFDHPPAVIKAPQVIDLGGQTVAVAPADDKPGSTSLTTATLTYDIEQPLARTNRQPEHAMKPGRAPAWYVPGCLPRIAALNASSPAVDDLIGSASRPISSWTSGTSTMASTARRTVPRPSWDSPRPIARAAESARRRAGESGCHGRCPLAKPRSGRLAGQAPGRRGRSVRVRGHEDPRHHPAAGSAARPPGLRGPRRGPAHSGAARRPSLRREPATPDHPAGAGGCRGAGRGRDPLRLEAAAAHRDPPPDAHARPVTGRPAARLHDSRRQGRRAERDRPGPSAQCAAHLRRRALRGNRGAELPCRGGRKVEFGASNVEIGSSARSPFVNALQSILPADGFDDPPYVTVDAQGVVAGYTLARAERRRRHLQHPEHRRSAPLSRSRSPTGPPGCASPSASGTSRSWSRVSLFGGRRLLRRRRQRERARVRGGVAGVRRQHQHQPRRRLRRRLRDGRRSTSG